MKYCNKCGTKLIQRYLAHEGMIPFCEHCQEYHFPLSNTAVSLIILDPEKAHILLIQQYGKKDNILVAGYVNQKESLEEAVFRECLEEIGRKVVAFQFMKSEYFGPSNTLMCNFVVVIEDASLSDVSEWEIDDAKWYTFEDARKQIKQGSLAQRFLYNFLEQWDAGKQ